MVYFRYLYRKRLTAHECLMHRWLAGDAAAARTRTLDARRYEAMRDRLRRQHEVGLQK